MTFFYVDDSVATTGNGTSWSSAWKSFSDINWSEIKPGDTVYISGGSSSQTYNQSLNVGASGSSGDSIVITNGVDAGHNGQVILDGGAAGVPLDTNSHTDLVIQNLTLQNSNSECLWVHGATSGSITVSGLVIHTGNGNPSADGRGIVVANNTGTAAINISNSTVDTPSSTTAQTDGIYTQGNTCSGNVIIEKNTVNILNTDSTGHSDGWQSYLDGTVIFRDNTITQAGALNNHGMIVENVVAGATLYAYDNIVVMNGADASHTSYAVLREFTNSAYTGNVKFWNNTIYGGYAGYDTYQTAGQLPAGDEFKNNIIYTVPGEVAPYVLTNGNLSVPSNVDNNLVYAPNGLIAVVGGVNETWSGWQALGYDTHGISADPQFTNAAAGDFRLTSASPAIDHAVTLPMVTTDYLGTPRPQGAGPDIGAYEFVASGSESSPSIPAISIGNASAPEGSAEVFTVGLSQPSTSTVSVHFSTQDGTAVAGIDYTATAGSLAFAPGETTKTIVVPVVDDGSLNEPNETFTVTLSNPSNAVLATTAGNGTIVEGQDLPVETPSEARQSIYPNSAGVAHGTSANEKIYATGAGQTLIGGGGDDIFVVGSHSDVTIIESKPGISEVLTSASVYTLPTGIDNLAATGKGSHVLTGNAGNNVIYGSNGDDTLGGGGGNNEFVVGTGSNMLTGGGGNNSYIFSSPKDHGNIITDFNPSADMIDLHLIMQEIGYHGSNPVADAYVIIAGDGHGNTVISVDPDGPSGSSAPHAVVTLQHVLPSSLNDGTNFVWH